MKKLLIIMSALFVLCFGASKEMEEKGYQGITVSGNQEIGKGAGETAACDISRIEFVSSSRFVPKPLGNATKILFSNGIEFDTRELGKSGEPELPRNLTTTYKSDEYGYYIVQIKGPIYEYHKTQLEANGVKVFFYVKNYAFVCGIPNQAVLENIRSKGDVTWVGIYQPAYKISSRIEDEPEEFIATILLFDDTDLNQTVNSIRAFTRPQEKILTSEFKGEGYTNKIIRTKIKKSDVANIAKLKEVYWIEPWHREVPLNQGSQWCVQKGVADSVRTVWRKGLRGAGQIICTCDTGVRPTQYFFDWPGYDPGTWYYNSSHPRVVAQRPSGLEIEQLLGYPPGSCSKWGDEAINDYHGTHTAGSACGWDSAMGGTSPQDGMAYQARLFFLDGGGDSGAVYLPLDLNKLYAWPYDSSVANGIPRVLTMSNSWGDSSINGGYDAECMETDQFCWSHKDFLVFFSNGNDGSYSGIGHRSGSPASAKNCMAVGALTHPGNSSGGANALASFSSRGPTTDGRYKPDITAPGENVVSAYGGNNTSTTTMSGTSMASPIAAGASLLIRQYLKEGWYPTGSKTPADSFGYILSDLIKAIIMHADSVGAVTGHRAFCVDTLFGWGRVNLDTVLYFAGDSCRLLLTQNLTGLVTGEEIIYKFLIPAGAVNIRITLAWTDYPSTPVSYGLINDLDLVAISPATPSVTYKGNMWTTTSPYQSAANPSGRDSVNVRESIRLASLPAPGIWTVKVQAPRVVYGPQPFALAVTYRLTAPNAVAGRVILDKPVYRANDFFVDTMLVRVEDHNYNPTGNIDTVIVRLLGRRIETQPETLKVPELANGAGVFEAKMPLLFHKAVHNDGKLSVGQNDTIRAIYVDNTPSFTDTMIALVDASYFLITDVGAELSPSGVDVAIKWKTNEQSTSKLYYGLTPSLGSVVQLDTPLVLNHTVNLTGLVQDTIYYFDVESKDYRNNVVRDNNGGRHYTFSTQKPKGADILVALLDGDDKSTPSGDPLPNLRTKFEAAIKAGGWAYDWWETSDHGGQLPPRNTLKTYKAIYAPSEDEYPPILQVQCETIKVYQEKGGRIAMGGHDFLWHAWQNSSNKAYDTTWCKNYLHARYRGDATRSTAVRLYGVANDPISGAYATSGVRYQAHRTGAEGDSLMEVDVPPNGWDAGGVGDSTWRLESTSGWDCGIRWESGQTHGTSGDGVWGGQKTRVVYDAFSITQILNMDTLIDVLNKEFIYLIGHDHPDVVVDSPATGFTYTSSPINIRWTATYYGGASNDTTWIEYSSDGGGTWRLITKGTGITSPYSWNLGTLQNGYKYRIKVTVSDKNVYPSLKGYGTSGNFVIKRGSGGDTLGPIVAPQSIVVSSNPAIVPSGGMDLPFNAVVSDSETGLSNISGAQWYARYLGQSSNTYTMYPSDAQWNDDIKETVLGSMRLRYKAGQSGICTLYVRARDNAARANNWGPWYYRTLTLIDADTFITIGVSEYKTDIPTKYQLFQPMPNPSPGYVRIKFALPYQRRVKLEIYNCLGQNVRTLIDEERKPGVYTIIWNGKDDLGRQVPAGIYFYQFRTDDYIATQKAVFLR
ncbi:MAG: S8 family serine peptidase [candidate division WOR-3 bacterium]